MKQVFVLLFCMCCSPLFSQTLEIHGGYLYNNYHELAFGDSDYSLDLKAGHGYAFGVSVDDFQLWKIKHRLTLRYEQFNGDISASDIGLGGGQTTEAEFDKTLLSLGVYPVRVKFLGAGEANLGVQYSRLLAETFEGRTQEVLHNKFNRETDLQDRYSSFNSESNWGLNLRVAYQFKLSSDWTLIPQYEFHYGFKDDFKHHPGKIKSMRHFVGVGLKKQLISNSSEKG